MQDFMELEAVQRSVTALASAIHATLGSLSHLPRTKHIGALYQAVEMAKAIESQVGNLGRNWIQP